MSNRRVIKRHGQEVVCFGSWHEDSNVLVVGDWADGTEMEEIWAEGAATWTQAVEIVTEWAAREGHTIMEMTSC